MSRRIFQHVTGPVGALFLSSLMLAGCAGHGKHTSQGLSLAQMRSAQIKSSTEWNMAHQAFLAGNLDKALRKIDEAISLNPMIAKSHLLKGRILIEKGRLGDALESLDLAIEFKPEDPEAYYYKGNIYERLERGEEALKAYQTAASLDPEKAQYAIAASEVLIDMGRIDEAQRVLETYASVNQDNPAIVQTMGTIAMLQERYDDAARLFNEARLLSPEDSGILEDLADALMADGRFAEAEFYLNTVLSDPAHADRRDLKQMRARCLIELDRPVEARALLLELTQGEEGSRDAGAWIELGRVAWQLRDLKNLQLSADRATRLAPESSEAWLLMALARREAGQEVAALDATDRALALDSRNQTVLMLRGLIQQELGRHDDALVTLQQAYILDPSNESVRTLIDTVRRARSLAIVEDK